MFIDLCEKLKIDSAYLGKITPIERHEVEDARLHDVIFPQVDLNWWRMEKSVGRSAKGEGQIGKKK